MKILKMMCPVVLLALTILLPACRSTKPVAETEAVPPELMQASFLHEIVRYLYRWELSESDMEEVLDQKQLDFWIRRLSPGLDPGDHSQFAEIIIPQLEMSVEVARADYTIAETGTVVKNPNFKIMRVTRGDIPKHPPAGCVVMTLETQEVSDYLYRTRDQRNYPDAALLDHLREAVREEAAKEGVPDTNLPAGEQMIDVAPVSPVANEAWIYWEAGDKLFYAASEIDLANPIVWKYEPLSVRIFDLDRDVVVSQEEVPGSDAFMTRDQMSRVLYNCMVLGKRTVVMPYSPANAAPAPKK